MFEEAFLLIVRANSHKQCLRHAYFQLKLLNDLQQKAIFKFLNIWYHSTKSA